MHRTRLYIPRTCAFLLFTPFLPSFRISLFLAERQHQCTPCYATTPVFPIFCSCVTRGRGREGSRFPGGNPWQRVPVLGVTATRNGPHQRRKKRKKKPACLAVTLLQDCCSTTGERLIQRKSLNSQPTPFLKYRDC